MGDCQVALVALGVVVSAPEGRPAALARTAARRSSRTRPGGAVRASDDNALFVHTSRRRRRRRGRRDALEKSRSRRGRAFRGTSAAWSGTVISLLSLAWQYFANNLVGVV